MMKFKKKCTEHTTQKKIVLAENKMRFIFDNPLQKEVKIVKVDHCQLPDNEVKCDFMAITDDIEYYIELKGQNIKYAVKQLENTIEKLSKDFKRAKKKGFVISSKSPLAFPQIQKIAKAFKKKYNCTFIVKNIQWTEKI